MQKLINYLKNETVLVISVILAIVSSFFIVPSIKYIGYIDFKVLACLFCLMIVVSGFKRMNILEIVSQRLLNKVTSLRKMYITIIFLTFISAMLITNDVALITFVPLTITILKMSDKSNYTILFVVLQTIAANLGSSLTPVGNPQNLYLFSFYNFDTYSFFKLTFPLVLVSGVLLFLCVFLVKNEELIIKIDNLIRVENKNKSIIYLILFIISVLCVFDIIPYLLSLLIVIIIVLFLDKNLFKEVDYSLLITFVGFFIFVGNISNIEVLKSFFAKILQNKELITSILVSQVISNVPAAILLSKFTEGAKEILLGVNIGGLGTLIASLASVISFKIYCKEKETNKGKFLLVFTGYNLIFLVVLTIFCVLAL